MSLQKRITDLVVSVSTGMHEREEIIAVSLLSALCGQNTFLYGPPGTAKSLISRRIACAFESPTYFEYLMHRFSTPEEVFGPVSIKDLKENRYVRRTDGYLPKAEFAFLDEIWKSSPAILNTLLTLINERIFRNGATIEKASLKALIAASNETPDANQGLEALYDRFIVRLMVEPIRESEHFDQLLNSKPTEAETEIPERLRVKPEEWQEWREKIHAVQLSSETFTIIHLIRESLRKLDQPLEVYVSDRRWQRAALLMKAAAFFNDRGETNHSDAVLLQHCLWSHEENRQMVMEIVAEAIKKVGFDSQISLAEIDREKESLDKEILNSMFHSTDVYETVPLGDQEFFEIKMGTQSFSDYSRGGSIYVPREKMGSKDKFHPVDKQRNEIRDVSCHFDGQGSCNVSSATRIFSGFTHKINVLFRRGDKKKDVSPRLIQSLSEAVSREKAKLSAIADEVEARFWSYEAILSSPFVPKEKSQLAVTGIAEQIDSLKLRIKDCERLEELCR